jgi:hypothetical protein
MHYDHPSDHPQASMAQQVITRKADLPGKLPFFLAKKQALVC